MPQSRNPLAARSSGGTALTVEVDDLDHGFFTGSTSHRAPSRPGRERGSGRTPDHVDGTPGNDVAARWTLGLSKGSRSLNPDFRDRLSELIAESVEFPRSIRAQLQSERRTHPWTNLKVRRHSLRRSWPNCKRGSSAR